jgi:hypothetical protein
VCRYWRAEFLGRVSYTRFVGFVPSALLSLWAYLCTCLGSGTGIAFLDSTLLAVCDNPAFITTRYLTAWADKGYLSHPLFQQLLETFDLQLITKPQSNMKNRLLPVEDKMLLRKRAIVETIIDQLKNISQIGSTRQRSATNFLVNLLCGLIAYRHQPEKPSLQLDVRPRLTAAYPELTL